KRSRIFLAAEGRDIRYRGPLSYRGLRIAAWVAILMWQIGLWLSLGAKVDAGFAEMIGFWPTVFVACRSLMTPLFLTATFAIILNNSRRFRSLLLMYGGFALLIVALFILVHDRYMLGILMNVLDLTREEAVDLIQLVIVTGSENGSFSFNIFVDLFLCTLFTCFVVYRPKRFFVGKKLIIFRLFALLPAAYEIASIVLKALASVGTILLPSYFIPFLTTKPPMTFLLFVSLTFFIKRREWLFRRNGKTHEEYAAFLGTRLNSLHFSTFVAKQFVVFALLDLLMMVILSFAVVGQFSASEEPFAAAVGAVSSWGFGDCLALLFATPFILLFSYTRTYKDTRPDIVINLVGVALVVLVHLEALYDCLIMELDTIKGALGT
ncbi:MAG: hypothetical protein IJT69_04680, partial [Clostridia bacterium]|nr:hypothetical protein [Clostridia bacterium]